MSKSNPMHRTVNIHEPNQPGHLAGGGALPRPTVEMAKRAADKAHASRRIAKALSAEVNLGWVQKK